MAIIAADASSPFFRLMLAPRATQPADHRVVAVARGEHQRREAAGRMVGVVALGQRRDVPLPVRDRRPPRAADRRRRGGLRRRPTSAPSSAGTSRRRSRRRRARAAGARRARCRRAPRASSGVSPSGCAFDGLAPARSSSSTIGGVAVAARVEQRRDAEVVGARRPPPWRRSSARAISTLELWAAQSSGVEPSPDARVDVGAGLDERADGLDVARLDGLHQRAVAAGGRHRADHSRGQESSQK